jgi:hypothetical protein
MQDLFNFINDSQVSNEKIYIGGKGTALQWFTWIKPRNVRMVYIFCLGGGGGGGAGLTGTASANRGGGAGGGSGAITQWLGPAYLLPDTLFIAPGTGGLGGTTSAAAGGAGLRSYVSIVSGNTTAANLLLISGAADAGGGAGGTTAAATAGAAGTIATSATAILCGMGLWTARVGQVGAAPGPSF